MKAVFVLFSIALLLFFLQSSAEESKDASISREVRSADAGKKNTRPKKGKKKCKGKKCNKKKNWKKGKRAGKEKDKKEGKKGKGKTGRRKRVRGRKGKRKTGRKNRGKKGKKGKGKKGKKGKGRRTKFSGRQGSTVPPQLQCTENTCKPKDYVNLFNIYKKNDIMLRQLQRLTRFYTLIKRKAENALTTFQPAADAISDSTNACTTCADASVSSAALSHCTVLQSCSVSAPSVCNTAGITYTNVTTNCTIADTDTCPADTPNKEQSCSEGCTNDPTTGLPLCTNVCRDNGTVEAALTEANVRFANETCIPVLRRWNKQYRDCNAGDTFNCAQSGCNPEKGTCNLQNCECAADNGLVERTCAFEECVAAKNTTGSDYKDFVCNTCLKKLNESLVIPDDCKRIAKYERAVFARKEECIRRNVAGSFGDCLASEKAVIPFIKPCLSTTVTSTAAPGGRRAAFKNKNMMLIRHRGH